MLERVHKAIQFVAVSFGIVIPCVMFSGFVYYLGYINTFGLDSSLVPRNLGDFFTESWYLGVLAFVYLFKFWWLPVSMFVAMSLLLFMVAQLSNYLKLKGKRYIANPISKDNPGRKILGLTQWSWMCWWDDEVKLYNWLMLPLLLVFIPYLVLISPFKQGENDALKNIERFSKHKCNPVKDKKDRVGCISLIDVSVTPNKVLLQGITVAANANRIAIYNGKVLEVWPLTSSMKVQKQMAEPIDFVTGQE